jgi:hypothetical protein
MYHHHIALAVAEARVGDLQRAASHGRSTQSPRRDDERRRPEAVDPRRWARWVKNVDANTSRT